MSNNNYSLFVKVVMLLLLLLCMFDDIFLNGNDDKEILSLKLFLDTQFVVSHYFLGLEILTDPA